jgi:hypothetical protein
VVLTNAIPALGVISFGWPSFHLIVLFIAEAVVVLVSDTAKMGFLPRARLLDKKPKDYRGILFFEYVFILFYGVFSLLVFSPHSEDFVLSQTFRTVAWLVKTDLKLPVLGIALLRLYRLIRDLLDAGVFGQKAKRPLELNGGGWMLLLFFAVVLAVVVARDRPNPKGGLLAIVALKTFGESLGIWAMAGVEKGKEKGR